MTRGELFPLDTSPQVRDEIEYRRTGDVGALLDVRTGVFYTLNETANLFWQLLQDGATIADITTRVANDYDVTPDEILNDLLSFLEFFSTEGVLLPGQSVRLPHGEPM